jgi:hypothetical protein
MFNPGERMIALPTPVVCVTAFALLAWMQKMVLRGVPRRPHTISRGFKVLYISSTVPPPAIIATGSA